MSESPTLHSRLRVLVAKTYRAEKLFSSIQNSAEPKVKNLAFLSDVANDIRAREWRNSHHELRDALNDILTLGVPSEVSARVTALREEFTSRYGSDRRDIERGVIAINDTAQREEFAQVMRFSLELVRLKARAQVHKAIADELTAILSSSGRLPAAERATGGDSANIEAAAGGLAAEMSRAAEISESSSAKVLQMRPRRTATAR